MIRTHLATWASTAVAASVAASSPVSSAYLATSPRPLDHSRAGSVARTAVSQSTPSGWWIVPTRFLPAGRLTAVLAADRGVHLAEQRRGELDEPDAAQVDRRHEPRHVGDHATAEADDDVATRHALAHELAAEPLDGHQRLGALALGDHVQRRVDARVEPLEPALVDDVLLGDDRRRPAPGRRAAMSAASPWRAPSPTMTS